MFKKITMTLASLALILGFSIATAIPATAASPLTACHVVASLGFNSHGLTTLDGNTVWGVWQPAETKQANNCNGVAVREWNDHNSGNKNTVAWVVIYPNYPSSTGSYQAQAGVGIVAGSGTWVSMGLVPDGKVYRVFAVDMYSGGNPNTPTADRES